MRELGEEQWRCGTIWRPADIPTNGVAAITTRGERDNWPGECGAVGDPLGEMETQVIELIDAVTAFRRILAKTIGPYAEKGPLDLGVRALADQYTAAFKRMVQAHDALLEPSTEARQ